MKAVHETVAKISPSTPETPKDERWRSSSALRRFFDGVVEVEGDIAQLTLNLPEDGPYLQVLELAKIDAEEKNERQIQICEDLHGRLHSPRHKKLTINDYAEQSLFLNPFRIGLTPRAITKDMTIFEYEDLEEDYKKSNKMSAALRERAWQCREILGSEQALNGEGEIKVIDRAAAFVYSAVMIGIKLACGEDQQKIDAMLAGIEYGEEKVRYERASLY